GCGFQRFGELGERIGQVFVVAADESCTVLVDDGHGSDAVPFHFEGPLAGRVVVVGDVGDVVDAAQGGQHRSDAVRSARWAGSLHQVYEPVVAGVDQRERGISVQSSPVL